jgi:transcriptional regulator with XRE-family HTH domain
MEIHKTSEKVYIWMIRENITGQKIADEIGITRQAWSQKLRDNLFTQYDMLTLKRMGFKE